jgi:type VI secretion system protein ImpL
MTQKNWHFPSQRNVLTIVGYLAFAALLLAGATLLDIPIAWALVVLLAATLAAAAVLLVRLRQRRRSGALLGAMLEQRRQPSDQRPDAAGYYEKNALRKRMLAAIATIRTSRLGQLSGDAALYELPWYILIGNPAAGKSSAIASSGLQFPVGEQKVSHGVGGTRNCDWFFTTDGILLDTAGRYTTGDEDRAEWFGFLGLLKKYRKRAPVNGVIIAVSIAELTDKRPEFAITLARTLRQRVQELTDKLGVHAPVYLMFTKSDLITGFSDFFSESDPLERDRVWGATLPYEPASSSLELLALFDRRFDELYEGLKDRSFACMALHRQDSMPSGVFSFPLEFNSIKAALRAFIATLFEENPFQYKPVFRGFYFTSALQEGAALSASSERVAQRFHITPAPREHAAAGHQHGYFLLQLFRKVIFPDKGLVSQYASPARRRLRYATFFAATMLVGLALAGWSWSYMANRQLIANVRADLDQVIRLQHKRPDLQSRFEAMQILQDRIEQLADYRGSRPWSLGLGLYQGTALDQKLRDEYFAGARELMLKPVGLALEAFLAEMNANADKLVPMLKPPQSGATPLTPALAAGGATGSEAPDIRGARYSAAQYRDAQYRDASPASVEDAYNALKTYLMLSDGSHAEAGHLSDQLSRYWRVWLETHRGAMPREQMIRSAERMISFYLGQAGDPSWPRIDAKLALIDQSRVSLRRVVRGMPARERVYADVRARAATRFPSMTVARIVGEQDKDLLVGSYAIQGTFTRDAWEKFVQQALRDASSGELQSADWVLRTSASDDLTLEGSPEQVQKTLIDLYKADYAREWQKFVQGVGIRELDGFEQAVAAMNRLGDPQTSPIDRLIAAVYRETSWDNPKQPANGLQRAQNGATGWFRDIFLPQKRSQLGIGGASGSVIASVASDSGSGIGMAGAMANSGAGSQGQMGPVGREFAGVAKLVGGGDRNAAPIRGYMELLSKLRGRFIQIRNQGDTGPGAKKLMQQTLDGNGSELADALRYVDEQMLVGMTDQQKAAIRPLLVRPLIQTFAVIVKPAETELNKVWTAQVLEPFQGTLATKYPFAPESRVEASNAEIRQVFGPEGAIARFFDTAVGPLVLRRGDTLSARTWANMGISLTSPVVAGFPGWVAPLAGSEDAPAAVNDPQTAFELQAVQATGATEFTIEIDGQPVHWQGQPQPWIRMSWPNAQGAPGARISATAPDGRNVVLLDESGREGLRKMMDAATRKRRDNGEFELSWKDGGIAVTARLRMLPKPAASPMQVFQAARAQSLSRLRLPLTIAGMEAVSQAGTQAGTAAGASVPPGAATLAGAAP